MTARVVEDELAGLRRLTVSGERAEVFHALGAAAASEVREILTGLPEGEALRRFAATPAGHAAVERVLAPTRGRHPEEYRDALELAAGAGIDPDFLLLANLRGDLGGDDGVGCSDLAWRGSSSFLAHNEDGAPALDGRLVLLTLAVDGEAAVTVQWYPGFLPCNTFVVTGHGLAWGINHIQVARPAAAPGRHFVARGLQRQPDLDSAVRYLTENPSAGGFAYTIGEFSTGRIVTVEAAAGRTASVEEQPLLWHTNHLRYLTDDTPTATTAETPTGGVRDLGHREESVARGKVLGELPLPESPDARWFLDVLTTDVYRSAVGDDPLLTLCTSVVDLTSGSVTFQARGNAPATFPVDVLS
ncbi:MAG TPA: C45 family peptidase [Pseudonocardiaceae bacterium]|nr:C45 family peptidase [Pseudonocardiaceae bacterium]